MKTALVLTASALALGLAGCGPRTPVARAALDCPANQGELTRTSVSPDGKACTYTTSGGAEVTLQLVSVQGGVDATLAQIETNLLANRVAKPAEADAAKGDKGEAKAGDAKAKAEAGSAKPAEAATAAGADAAAKAAAEASADSKAGVHVEVSKDGKSSVVTEDGDGTTRVNLPGIHIVANDHDDSAHVQVGPINVNAGDDKATIHMRSDVRLRGEALNPQKRGIRAMFLYKGDDLPDGYKFVGYEAGGPKAGPITVAVVKSKSEDLDGDEIYNDVKRLVRKNGGV